MPNSVDELCAAALAVVQAARRTGARAVMTLPDWQINRLRKALEAVDAEWCEQNPDRCEHGATAAVCTVQGCDFFAS